MMRAPVQVEMPETSDSEIPDAEHGGPAHWLDEFWSVVLAVPMLASFFPYAQEFVSRGFVILGEAPAWYLGAVAVSIAWGFGRKAIVNAASTITAKR